VSTSYWKERLYAAYVTSGQASPRRVSSDRETVDVLFRPYAPHVRHLIARHIPPDLGAQIVDLGCGDGMLLHFLDQAGYANTLGIDGSVEQVARAHALGVTQVRLGDISRYLDETPDASVDVVLLMDVLEHMTREDLFRVLDGALRILRRGGVCLAHLPNAEGIHGMRIRYGDFTHEQAFTAQSARQVLRTVGFRDVHRFEDRPVVHGVTSLVRRVIWDVATLPHRLLLAAETGERSFIVSQTFLVRAVK